MQLTLGPLLFNWPVDAWRDFYFQIADEAPVDTVVIGEVVCAKRAPLHTAALQAVLERLARSDKEIVLATLALATSPRERRMVGELAENTDYVVEANDVTCLAHLSGTPHDIGPLVNVYNEQAAAFLASEGARRICLPPELPAASIGAIARGAPDVHIETFAFGRVPLAISARCYHARLHKLTKDSCRYVCEQDLDGLLVATIDDEPFLAVNGVQTLSHGCAALCDEVDELAALGVASLRLSPQRCDMTAVAHVFRDLIDRRVDGGDARGKLAELFPAAPLINGFIHGAPGARHV